MPLLRAGLRGRFRQLSADGSRLSVELPPAAADVTVDLAAADPSAVVTLDGTRAPESRIGPLRRDGDGPDWLPIRIPPHPAPAAWRSSANCRAEQALQQTAGRASPRVAC